MKVRTIGIPQGSIVFPDSILTGYTAKVVVLWGVGGRQMAIEGRPAEEVARAIEAGVAKIRQHQPQAKILLNPATLPSIVETIGGPVRADVIKERKPQFAKAKQLVAKLADGKHVFFVDPEPKLVEREKEISDQWAQVKGRGDVHLLTLAWGTVAEVVAQRVKELLKQ